MAYLKVVNENGTKRLIDYSKAPQYNKLAVNEPTTTASQSYTKGEYLTQGGYFKKVTNAIASGDTISSSNTEDTTVGEELTQINSDLSDYTKDFETLSNLVAFTNFDIALPQDITTGSKVRILIHESSVDVWFTKELICGVDFFMSQPAKRIFNVGGYYVNPNSCGSCFIQVTANGRLQYNSIQLNGVDKSATTTIACVLFRA